MCDLECVLCREVFSIVSIISIIHLCPPYSVLDDLLRV